MKTLSRDNIRRSSWARKIVIAMGMTMLVSVMSPVAAQAEMVFKPFSHVLNGFQSGRWYDGNAGWTQIHTSGCNVDHGTPQHRTLTLEVKRDLSFFPDDGFGVGDARDCYWTTATTTYLVKEGNNYFQVGGLQPWQRVSADPTVVF